MSSSGRQQPNFDFSEIISSIQVYSYTNRGTTGHYRLANRSLQLLQELADSGMLCLSTDAQPYCQARAVRGCSWTIFAPVYPSFLNLFCSCGSMSSRHDLFSLQRSSTRTHAIIRSVHRCGALSIELLQRQVALVLHYSSLLEVCDLHAISIALRLHRPFLLPQYPSTHPATCACALEFSELRRAHFSCLLVFSHAVDDVVLV